MSLSLTNQVLPLLKRTLGLLLVLSHYSSSIHAEPLSPEPKAFDFYAEETSSPPQAIVPPALAWGLEQNENQQDYQLWLDWLENTPGQLGFTSYFNEPLIAGEQQDVTIRYQAGVDLLEGSKIAVLAPWESGIEFQIEDLSKPNYIEVRSFNQDLSLIATELPAQVPFSSWYKGRSQLAFEVQGAPLLMGEELEFVITNLQLPGRAGVVYLPVAFALPETEVLFTPGLIELLVQPNRTEQVALIAPSRLGRNAPGELTLRLEDRYGNPSVETLPTFDLLLDGRFVQRITPTNAVTKIAGVSFSEPGTHWAEVRTGGGSLRGNSNPIVVQSGNRQVEWFDLSPDVATETLNTRFARRDYRDGGSKLEVFTTGSRFDVAIPYAPTEDRGLDDDVRLAAIAAGESQYEWFANRLLQKGYRLGFAGGEYSPLKTYGVRGAKPNTAAIGGSEGLYRGATYVTTGPKIVVHATVNGALPGSRVSAAQDRKVSGWVQGTGPIDRVELIKNGSVIDTIRTSDEQSQTLKISMRSSSEPIRGQRDRPRNGREWIGYVRASESPLSLVGTPGFRNPLRQAAAQNGAQRVDFITWTHGGFSSLFVSLSGASEDEVIELNIREGMEDTDIPTDLREPAPTPATRQMIPLFDLEAGPITRRVAVAGYEDEIRFELVNPDAPDYLEFSFSDLAPYQEEDYYYLRVIQHDDHVAWTSPVFVGGFDGS